MEGRDGNFYGTTFYSGTNRAGTVFRISPNGSLTTLYSFSRDKNGAAPDAGLVASNDGNFYGTTFGGGDYGSASGGYGTVFKISPSGALTSLYSFTQGNDGGNPAAPLVQGSDGNFYGTTLQGGTSRLYGTVFRISPEGALASLHSFTGGNDGGRPNGLVQGRDGNFYGTTSTGGTNHGGTVFRISPSGSLTTLYSFSGTNDGKHPWGPLAQGSDGNLYGTTRDGGMNDSGTVFRISANGALTSLYAFSGGEDGVNPQAGLVQGRDGDFYGTTTRGGLFGGGTVFQISANGSLTSLYSFRGTNGGFPSAQLVQGSDGSFCGTTRFGGAGSQGIVFKISTDGR